MVGRRAGFWAPCWRDPTVIYGFAGGTAPTWSAPGRNLWRPVGAARRRYMALPERRRQQGRPPGGILGALLAWPDGDIWLCRRGGANRSRRRQMAARNFCEDFAPRNEAARLCGERGANRVPKNSGGITSAAVNLSEKLTILHVLPKPLPSKSPPEIFFEALQRAPSGFGKVPCGIGRVHPPSPTGNSHPGAGSR